jgi:hypothetical protein
MVFGLEIGKFSIRGRVRKKTKICSRVDRFRKSQRFGAEGASLQTLCEF